MGFGLSMFSFDLSRRDKMLFKRKRVYSIVLLENVPQLLIQIIFVNLIKEWDPIAGSAMMLSFVSIFVSIAGMLTEKRIMNDQSIAVVQFSVCSDEVMVNMYRLKRRVFKIRDQLAGILGLNEPKLVEMQKPMALPGGLRVTFYIWLEQVDTRLVDYEKVLTEAVGSGRVVKIVQSAWDLNQVPTVSDLYYSEEISRNQRRKSTALGIGVPFDKMRSESIATPGSQTQGGGGADTVTPNVTSKSNETMEAVKDDDSTSTPEGAEGYAGAQTGDQEVVTVDDGVDIVYTKDDAESDEEIVEAMYAQGQNPTAGK